MLAGFKGFRKNLPQILAVFAGTIGAISDGMHYGWTSPALEILQSPETPVQIKESHVVWIENIYMIGGFAGLPVTIFCVNAIGRKGTILLSAVQHLISWIILATAHSIELLLVARFIAGMAGDVAFVSAPMYISEIADKKIRGFLGSCIYVMMLVGILVVYSVVPFVSIPISSAVGLSCIALQLLTLPFMPESPYYYFVKEKPEEAKRSLQRLRGNTDITAELEEIAYAVKRQQSERGKLIDLFIISSNRKAFLIIAVILVAQHMSSVMMMNIHPILSDAKSSSPHATSIVFSAIMLISAFVASFLIDKTGRKLLLITSTVLTGLSLLVLAMYFTFKNSGMDVSHYNWIPMACVMVYAVVFKFGLGLVPIVLTAELFPTAVKAYGMTLSDMMYLTFSIMSIYIFIHLSNTFGMHAPFYLFAVLCFLTTLFTIFVIPETKGKTLEEIQMILKGNKIVKDEEVPENRLKCEEQQK